MSPSFWDANPRRQTHSLYLALTSILTQCATLQQIFFCVCLVSFPDYQVSFCFCVPIIYPIITQIDKKCFLNEEVCVQIGPSPFQLHGIEKVTFLRIHFLN